MSLRYFPGVGLVHLQEVKPPRVVPGPERHSWASKPAWGESTTCTKCQCVKRRQKPEYIETYQMPGGALLTERPACTGKAATPKPTQGELPL